jgi:hypothetical protein
MKITNNSAIVPSMIKDAKREMLRRTGPASHRFFLAGEEARCQCDRCRLIEAGSRIEAFAAVNHIEDNPEKIKKLSALPLMLELAAPSGLAETVKTACFCLIVGWPFVVLPLTPTQPEQSPVQPSEEIAIVTKEFIEITATAAPQIDSRPVPPAAPTGLHVITSQ